MNLGLATLAATRSAAKPIFYERGYYLLPCRTPTLGYTVYRDLVDDLARDRVNTLILWLGGGPRIGKPSLGLHFDARQ